MGDLWNIYPVTNTSVLVHNKGTDLALGSVNTWAREFIIVEPTHSPLYTDHMGFVGAILDSQTENASS